MTEREHRFTVEASEVGVRLDAFVAGRPGLGLSRAHAQRLIEGGRVTVGGRPGKSSRRLAEGEEVAIVLPEVATLDLVAQDLPLDVLYEDEDVIVINKPRGLVVHPAAGHSQGTLVNALLYHCRDLGGINDVLRPGIVHRLDKDTSGVMMAAKSELAHRNLVNQIKGRMVRREYLALVHGVPPATGAVEAPIGRDPRDRKRMAVNWEHGRPAVTHFALLEDLGAIAGSLVGVVALGLAFGYLIFWRTPVTPSKGEQDYQVALAQVKADPNNLASRIALGQALLELNRYDDARKEFQAALKIEPNSIEAVYYTSLADIQQGKLDDAAATLQDIKTKAPQYLPARASLGYVLFKQGKSPEALKEYHFVETYQPGNTNVLYRIAEVYESLGQKQDAILYYKRVLEYNPQYPGIADKLKALGGN